MLPVQSLLLTAFFGPFYGFSALISPIDSDFGRAFVGDGWSGAVAGSVALLFTAVGAVYRERVHAWAGTPRRMMLWMHIALFVSFVLGAAACHWRLYWLLLVGFAVPGGVIGGVLNASSALFLTHWARRFNRAGLQAGVFGMMYGVWGAAFSLLGPFAIDSMGLGTWFLVSGAFVFVLSFAGIVLFVPPPSEATAGPGQASERVLTNKEILRMSQFWIFAVFFGLFLVPGFGFKIIVQVLGKDLFHASTSTSAVMAAAFLASYALGRLVFGLIADHVSLKFIYLMFCVVQIVALLVMGFALPTLTGAAFFTVLMCIVGSMFAAGKSLWSLVLLRIYGAASLHRALAMTLPVFGLAGFFGPLTLNFAVRQQDLLDTTRIWIFVMVGVLAVCVVLFSLLRGLEKETTA